MACLHPRQTAPVQPSTTQPSTAPALPNPVPAQPFQRPEQSPPSRHTLRAAALSPAKRARRVCFRASERVLLTRSPARHSLNANAASRSGLVRDFTLQPLLPSAPQRGTPVNGAEARGVPGRRPAGSQLLFAGSESLWPRVCARGSTQGWGWEA